MDDAQPVLTIDLAGAACEVRPPRELTFGRAAELVVDDSNPYLHRIVGRFVWHADAWWLENLGGSIELELVTDGGAVSRLPAREPDGPPVVTAVTAPTFRVRFAAGGLPYELLGSIGHVPVPPGAPVAPALATGTFGYGTITLTDDEKAMLVLLAAPCLADPTAGAEALPTNSAVAARLGWSLPKFNRKLDYLCTRLTDAGVRGLSGNSRRWRLVEHAINARMVKPTDLD